MKRMIGIRHRVKATVAGVARPTEVAVKDGERNRTLVLADEQSELDFVLGHYPVSYRPIAERDELSSFKPHHIEWKEVKDEKDLDGVPEKFVKKVGKATHYVVKVPNVYDGLASGDTVAMVLGGSGDCLAYALANRGEELGARVLRLPPFVLSKKRDERRAVLSVKGEESKKKDDDATLLAELASGQPHLFYTVEQADRDLIWLRECLRARTDAMKARIACEQRLRQRVIGSVFCTEAGKFPAGGIEKFFDEKKASDVILVALEKEEASAERSLAKATEKLAIYSEVLGKVEGCGVMIASRIIASVIDIRRFETDAKLKAFMGAHVQEDGRFPRKRTGTVANWHNDARQALYLIGDQFNKRPNSYWGKYQRAMKANLRGRHPEVVVENGKKRYTDAHILKMASWRTLTRFIEWLFKEWWALERARSAIPLRKAA